MAKKPQKQARRVIGVRLDEVMQERLMQWGRERGLSRNSDIVRTFLAMNLPIPAINQSDRRASA